jgi:hypothetical protein
MTNDERKRWLDRIDRLTYDGSVDISRFLTLFDQCRSKLLAMDPPEEEEILFTFFQEALKNASAPPQRGVDGERYIGPATWLDRQPMSEVDTYEKLCDKLRAKFSRAATRDKDQVMRELQRMTFNMSKTTVKEFAEAWEETIGSLEIDKMWRMELFMQRMPRKIQEEFQRQGHKPRWRSKSWEQLKEALIEAEEEIRNPDPIFNRLGVDGERNIGPASWYAKQPVRDINMYDERKAKLEFKFRAKIDNRAAVIARLAKMKRKHRSVQDFARDFDEICGDFDFDDETLITIFIKQLPVKVFDRLDWFYPEFRTLTYSSVKNHCIAFDNVLRNPFPREGEALARIDREIAQHKARKARLEQGTLCSAKDLSSNRNYSSAQTYGKRDAIHAPHSYENVHGGNLEQSVRHDLPFLDEESSNGAEHVQLAVPPAEDSNNCGQEDAQFSEHVEQPDSPVIAKPVPTSSAGPFTHSTAAGSSSDGHDHVEPLVHPAVSKVFVVKRFTQCPLDIKMFLPTLDHTMLENVRSEDRKSRLALGFDPLPHTTPSEELRRVDIEALDTTVKTVAGSRDDCPLHTVTGVSIGRSPVLICGKMTEVNGKSVPSEYKMTRLGPVPEPPPCTTLADSEELYQVDVDITVKTTAGSRDDRSLHSSTPTGHSAVTIHCKMVEVNGKHVASEYKITRLGPGPEPPPEHDVRSLDFGRVKLTFFIIDSWRTSACNYWPQNANSRGPQHSMIPYYVDKPDPDPEPPPGCLNSSPDGEDQGVGPQEGCSLHGLCVSFVEHSKVRPYNLRIWWGMRRRDGKG